jgi:cytidylate kinase
MAVITISRETGSGGYQVAKGVAESLGYALVDKATTDSIFRQYGLTRYDELYSSAPNILDILNADNLLLVAMSNEIIEAIAQRGDVVILGRAGFAVLSGLADVLQVRVVAPFSERVQRIMEREGLTDVDAVVERVKNDDEIHRKYVQRFYNKQWDDASAFDLMLDTGNVSIEDAVQKVVAAARAVEQRPLAAIVTTSASLKVDPVLADAVQKAMAGLVATESLQ